MKIIDVMCSWRINFWDINFLGTPPLDWYYTLFHTRERTCLIAFNSGDIGQCLYSNWNRGCNVINFEINFIFLIKPFFYILSTFQKLKTEI